jgi:hypothetical protein
MMNLQIRSEPLTKEAAALKDLEEMIANNPYVIRLFVEWHWNHDRTLINSIDYAEIILAKLFLSPKEQGGLAFLPRRVV